MDRCLKHAGAVLLLLAALAGHAADNVLLIQHGTAGYTVWHSEGPTQLDDDVVLEIMASAEAEGGVEMTSPVGRARAFARGAAVEIRFSDLQGDNALLVDRDACGHIHVWHAAGARQVPEDQLTEIMLTALPGGGKRLRFGNEYVKGFIIDLGVTATFWQAAGR